MLCGARAMCNVCHGGNTCPPEAHMLQCCRHSRWCAGRWSQVAWPNKPKPPLSSIPPAIGASTGSFGWLTLVNLVLLAGFGIISVCVKRWADIKPLQMSLIPLRISNGKWIMEACQNTCTCKPCRNAWITRWPKSNNRAAALFVRADLASL